MSLLRRTIPLATLTAALALAGSRATAADTSLASPDGRIQFRLVSGAAGGLTYEVRFNGRPVVEPSRLGITVDGTDLATGAAVGTAEGYEVNERYPTRGVHAEAVNHRRGLKIPVTPGAGQARWTLEVRAYNDGVGFRCVVPGGDRPRVPDEATAFTLPAGSTVWYHDLEGHYEDVHVRKGVAEVQAGEWVAPPLTAKLPGGGYAAITEAALVNYSGMALRADGERRFKAVLGHAHHVSYPFRLRYAGDVERLSKPASVAGTITTPWRVVMVGADLNTLVNSDLVANLCPPADPTLFPQGVRTDWVKPGRAVWRYLDGGQNNFDTMKDFSRLAGELGFEYHVIEGFWSRWPDEQLKELADYSRQRGVGLWLWRHSNRLRTPAERDAFFKKLNDCGAVGAKIDFFDHEHREVVDLYTTLLAEAAKHKIMVNFHGANKPTGEVRTWPNELIREGVRGLEASRLQTRALHNATLPFTRYLAGHGDYTPVHFGARRADTTAAHQVATAAVFNEPLLTYGAHPATLLKHPALPMIKAIPAVWDETVVLPGSEIGEAVALARRSGDAWFLAVLNGPAARTLKVPLTFLPAGRHAALVVRDHADDAAQVLMEQTSARRSDEREIVLRPGGGYIARFARAE